MIVTFGSNKGGVGKSTACLNVGVELISQGHKVAFVDADKQGSLANWSQDRKENELEPSVFLVQLRGNVSSNLQELDSNYDYVLVDTAGSSSKELVSALAVSELALCPTEISQFDLMTLLELRDQYEQISPINPALKIKIFCNRVPTHSAGKKIEREEFLEFMQPMPEFEPLESRLSLRKIFRTASAGGGSVFDYDDEKAIAEVRGLVNEVFKNG